VADVATVGRGFGEAQMTTLRDRRVAATRAAARRREDGRVNGRRSMPARHCLCLALSCRVRCSRMSLMDVGKGRRGRTIGRKATWTAISSS
jgi:hypothetical protein